MISESFRSTDKVVKAPWALWINLYSVGEFIIACTGEIKQTCHLGRSNRKIIFNPCQAKSCMLQCSRFLIFSFFSGLNHCISWHTLSKYQSFRKLQVLSAACFLPADLIPPFHLRLSPSEMELCHLLGRWSRIKNYFQKPECNTEEKKKEKKIEHSFALLQRHSGLLEVYAIWRSTLLERDAHKKGQIGSSLVNMSAHCIIVLKHIYFIFQFKYETEFSVHQPCKRTCIFFKYVIFFFFWRNCFLFTFPSCKWDLQ